MRSGVSLQLGKHRLPALLLAALILTAKLWDSFPFTRDVSVIPTTTVIDSNHQNIERKGARPTYH